MDDAGMGIVMIHVKNHMRAMMAEGLSDTPVKPNHVPILVTVASNPGRSITEISEMTGLDKSTVTRTVQQLVDIGLIDREGSPRQMNRVYLTDEGMKNAELAKELESMAWDKLLSELSEDEVDALRGILGKIMVGLKGRSSEDAD